jgi:hypothetical protein
VAYFLQLGFAYQLVLAAVVVRKNSDMLTELAVQCCQKAAQLAIQGYRAKLMHSLLSEPNLVSFPHFLQFINTRHDNKIIIAESQEELNAYLSTWIISHLSLLRAVLTEIPWNIPNSTLAQLGSWEQLQEWRARYDYILASLQF